MAIGPIDYLGAMPQVNLAQQLGQGLAVGNQIAQMRQQQQAQEQAQQLAQQYRTDVQSLFSSPAEQRLEGVQRLMLQYPQQKEAFAAMLKTMPEEQKSRELTDTISLVSVLNTGRYDIAEQMVTKRIEAARNSGQDTSSFEALLDNIRTDPQGALTTTAIYAAGLPGGDKALEALTAARKMTGVVRKTEADATAAEVGAQFAAPKAEQELQQGVWTIENLRGQIGDRVARLALDTDRLESEIQGRLAERDAAGRTLSPGLETFATNAVTAAVVADESASKSLSLAQRFRDLAKAEPLLGAGWGAGATLAEKAASVLGSQDAWTAARSEFLRLRNSAVVKSLPPGPSTDRDIELFSKGFPPDTADAKYMADWLEALGRAQRREAALESARAEWVTEAGSAVKTRRDIEVSGVKVPAGTTFDTFARQFVGRLATQRGAGEAANIMRTRSYMEFAR